MTTDCSLNYKKIQAQHMLCTQIVLNVKTKNNLCTQYVLNLYCSCNSMNNLLSYNGLIDARMRASDKDLPVFKNKRLSSTLDQYKLSHNQDGTI